MTGNQWYDLGHLLIQVGGGIGALYIAGQIVLGFKRRDEF